MFDDLLQARLKTLTPNVYANVAPIKYATPCAVHQIIDTDTITDLDGTVADEGYVTVQISVSSTNYGEAKRLARIIKLSLIEWDHPEVQSVSWINEHMMADATTETTLHRALLFFKFFCAL